MTRWVRIVLTIALAVGSALIFACGFPRLDEVLHPVGNTLSQASSGFFAPDWTKLDPSYIATHVLLDVIFIAAYGAFFYLAATSARGEHPKLAAISLNLLALAVVLDLSEDVGFLLHVYLPPQAWAKLAAFAATFVVTAVRLGWMALDWLRRRRLTKAGTG